MHLIDRKQSERPSRAGLRIVIAGTGGQGVLTAARLLCEAFVARGHHVVSGQLHGMAQRGGSVQATVVIDGGISPVIAGGRADVVIGFEPAETVRSLPLMSSRSAVYMNTAPVIPFVLGQRYLLDDGDGDYPDVERLAESIRVVAPRLNAFDASRIAAECGAAKALNMVMLGSTFGSGVMPCTADEFWSVVSDKVPPKLKEVNSKAFRAGARVGELALSAEGAS